IRNNDGVVMVATPWIPNDFADPTTTEAMALLKTANLAKNCCF
ncbi:hypothetical protein A2U01_0116969, partial [Trifolium medium]|nr:hypothetical protein [Trifolium medium]